MPRISFDDVPMVKLVWMGDALLRKGDARLAHQLYGAALSIAPPEGRHAILIRMGLATAPKERTSMLLAILEETERGGFRDGFVGEGLATWNKAMPFFDDPRFVEMSNRHAALLPLPNWQWNLQTALWAAQQAKGVPGDFVELGVYKGHTTLFLADYVEFQAWDKQWWLYDTFDGIPDDQLDPGWDVLNKVYKGSFSYEEVAARFGRFPNIKVIQGRVPEVLARSAPETIAFMHVDLNNSRAEIAALDALFDRVSSGGIILFDDFCWANASAQRVAEQAWFAERELSVLPLPTGQAVLVKGS